MCLNQLLEDEQIALMRYSAATKPSEVMRYRRKIESLGQCEDQRAIGTPFVG